MSKLEPTRTYSNPTATDELRAMLDELGVEHKDFFDQTWWEDSDGAAYIAVETRPLDNNNPSTKLMIKRTATPEQAIAATLGSGTCVPVLDSERDSQPYLKPRFVCSECGCQLTESRLGKVWQNYCPNCGRRVEQ